MLACFAGNVSAVAAFRSRSFEGVCMADVGLGLRAFARMHACKRGYGCVQHLPGIRSCLVGDDGFGGAARCAFIELCLQLHFINLLFNY